MDKSVLGLVAVMTVATPFAAAHATAVTPEDAANALRVSSVADLLDPVPNSLAILAALSVDPEAGPADKGVQLAQWHHHHHHHHHFYHHHHHHHHHWRWHHHHHYYY
jgi:hypothetical protein